MSDNMSSFTSVGKNEYFKVHWTHVLDLVHNRKVFLCDGFAYVVQTDVISGVCQTFRSELSQELTVSLFLIVYNMFILSCVPT